MAFVATTLALASASAFSSDSHSQLPGLLLRPFRLLLRLIRRFLRCDHLGPAGAVGFGFDQLLGIFLRPFRLLLSLLRRFLRRDLLAFSALPPSASASGAGSAAARAPAPATGGGAGKAGGAAGVAAVAAAGCRAVGLGGQSDKPGLEHVRPGRELGVVNVGGRPGLGEEGERERAAAGRAGEDIAELVGLERDLLFCSSSAADGRFAGAAATRPLAAARLRSGSRSPPALNIIRPTR
jgi:hypothetical protein